MKAARWSPAAPRRIRCRRLRGVDPSLLPPVGAGPRARPPSPAPDPRFRPEAWVAWQGGGENTTGDLLRLEPGWLLYGYRLLVGLLVALAAFLLFGRTAEYGSGPLLVRFGERLELMSPLAGTVAALPRRPGEEVTAGETLVQLWDVDEAAELELINREWKAQLLARLRRPDDAATAAALSGLASQRRFAEVRLAARAIVAPRAGRVGDLRVLAGQAVVPGQVLLTLEGDAAAPSVMAFLPGDRRPLLAPGQTLRATLDGFPNAEIELEIAEVGGEVLGPAEARRLVPGGEGLELTGRTVWLRAQLPAKVFSVGGRELPLYDGMRGQAEVKLRERRVFFLLFPFLEFLGPEIGS